MNYQKVPILPTPILRGASTGGGGGRGPPLGPKYAIFSWFLPLNYVICIFDFFFKLLLCERTEEVRSMAMSLRKVDISHPTMDTIMKNLSPPGPLKKILCSPMPILKQS